MRATIVRSIDNAALSEWVVIARLVPPFALSRHQSCQRRPIHAGKNRQKRDDKGKKCRETCKPEMTQVEEADIILKERAFKQCPKPFSG